MKDDKSINMGGFKLLPPLEKKFELYYDLMDYLKSSGLSYRAANYKEISYLKELNVITRGYIFKKYAMYLPGDIIVTIPGYHGSSEVIIQDPEEIRGFMVGKIAYGSDQFGSDIEVYKDSEDWVQEKYIAFIVSDI